MFKSLSTERQGEIYITLGALLWSFFPIITILSGRTVLPLASLFFTSLFATVFFGLVVLVKKKTHELLNRKAFGYIMLSAVLIGVLFYGLFFAGLEYTSAGNASIVALFEVFATMIILGAIFGKERMSWQKIIGAVLMVIGALLVLFKGSFVPNKGDLLILIATLFPPIANYYVRKAMSLVSAESIGFLRSLFGAALLIIPVLLLKQFPSADALHLALPFLIINGVVLFGIDKILWLQAIHRLGVSKSIALHSMSPAATLILAFFILGEHPSLFQILGFIPILLGIFLLTDFVKFQKKH